MLLIINENLLQNKVIVSPLLEISIAKRFSHKDRPMGHASKLLQVLAKKTPLLDVASVMNTPQKAPEDRVKLELEVSRELPEFPPKSAEPSHPQTSSDILNSTQMAVNYFYENFKILRGVDPRIIYSGCVYPLTGLTKAQEDFISQSKAATENTICDASLAMKNFDFKALPSPTNNYVVLWNYESFNTFPNVIPFTSYFPFV